MQDLTNLMSFINSKYVFSEENYPALKGKTTEEKAVFALNHSVLHMQKSIGVLATQCEAYDHSGNFNNVDQAALKEATAKMLVNTLKLAHELGFSPEQLAEAVPLVMKSK